MSKEVVINLPKPYQKQLEIITDPTRFKVLCIGRRAGKSVICKILTVRKIVQGLRVAYITPEFGLGDTFFEEIVSMIPESLVSKKNKSNLYLKLITGGELKFFSGEALHRARGREYDFLICDEAAYIPDLQKEWNTSLRPLLMKTQGGALFASTPNGRNYFYSLFEREKEDKSFRSWQFSSYENPHLPISEIENLKNELPESAYGQEIMAIPGEMANNPFGIQNIDNCLHKELSNKPTVCYGVDFGQKNDYTAVIGQDEDGAMSYFDRWRGIPWIQTLDRIRDLRNRDGIGFPPIIVDSTANQSSLSEDLQMTIYNVIGFDFTQKTKPAIMLELIKDVERGLIKVNEITANEMKVLQYKLTATAHIKYEAQSGFKDDCVMALAMCNYYRKKSLYSYSTNDIRIGTF